MLKALRGHPAIPEILGYGRVQHFEYLSLQLLGQSLGDVLKEGGPISLEATLEIADQMVSRFDSEPTPFNYML